MVRHTNREITHLTISTPTSTNHTTLMHAFAAKLGALALAPFMFFGGHGQSQVQHPLITAAPAQWTNHASSTATSITSIDGPTSLALNTSGTWTVHVTAPEDTTLQYSVKWGDEASSTALRSMAAAMVNTSGTFTHTYASKGTYHPEFTVTDSSGVTSTKSANVTVGAVAKLHLTAVTPTSGAVGDTATVTGTGFTSSSTVTVGGVAASNIALNDNGSIGFTIPSLKTGTYNIRVHNGDTNSNVVSFKVTAKASAISVSGIDAPVSLAVGANGTWTVHASTNADNLHYSVVWGDEGSSTMRAMALTSSVQTSSTFTHAYQTTGTFNPKFTISDDNGHSESVSASVVVRASK